MTCPNCGAAAAPGERFCGTCGHALSPPEAAAQDETCPHCGAAVAPGERFCGSCGRELAAVEPAPQAAAPRPSSNRAKLIAAAAAALVLVGAAAAFLLTRDEDEEASASGAGGEPAAEVFAEPVSSVGNDPFTGTVVPQPGETPAGGSPIDPAQLPAEIVDRFGGEIGEEDVAQLVNEVTTGLNPPQGSAPALSGLGQLEIPTGGAGVPTVSGSASGLYGGTQLIDVCDKGRLIDFLESNADKAGAWARVQGIQAAEIEAYVSGLTDVVLQADTRVTNHGFRDGRANPLNSILQAGTAVLVDVRGVPRVRCACGNPLLPARPLATRTPKVRGTPWPGFSLPRTVAIQPAGPIDEFTIDDVLTQSTFVYREPGAPAAEGSVTPGGQQPPPPPPPPPASGEVTLLHVGTGDEVGPGSVATPDGGIDAHFVLTVQRPGTVVDIDLRTADESGAACCGQIWNTTVDGNWILGVFRDGSRLNPVDQNISDTVDAGATYDLYANTSGYFNAGQNFIVTVTFDDGTQATALTTYSG